MKRRLILICMIALAQPIGSMAQDGLFQRGVADEVYYGFGGNPMLPRNGETGTTLSNQGFGNPMGGSNLTNQTFGAPIGSGLLIMLLAGAGYKAMKSNKKNNENKE